jgi:hypothetical protein
MKKFNLEASNAPKLTAAQAAKLNNMTDGQIDYSDIPELEEAFFAKVAFLENWPPAKNSSTSRLMRMF